MPRWTVPWPRRCVTAAGLHGRQPVPRRARGHRGVHREAERTDLRAAHGPGHRSDHRRRAARQRGPTRRRVRPRGRRRRSRCPCPHRRFRPGESGILLRTDTARPHPRGRESAARRDLRARRDRLRIRHRRGGHRGRERHRVRSGLLLLHRDMDRAMRVAAALSTPAWSPSTGAPVGCVRPFGGVKHSGFGARAAPRASGVPRDEVRRAVTLAAENSRPALPRRDPGSWRRRWARTRCPPPPARTTARRRPRGRSARSLAKSFARQLVREWLSDNPSGSASATRELRPARSRRRVVRGTPGVLGVVLAKGRIRRGLTHDGTRTARAPDRADDRVRARTHPRGRDRRRRTCGPPGLRCRRLPTRTPAWRHPRRVDIRAVPTGGGKPRTPGCPGDRRSQRT